MGSPRGSKSCVSSARVDCPGMSRGGVPQRKKSSKLAFRSQKATIFALLKIFWTDFRGAGAADCCPFGRKRWLAACSRQPSGQIDGSNSRRDGIAEKQNWRRWRKQPILNSKRVVLTHVYICILARPLNTAQLEIRIFLERFSLGL